MSIKIRTNAEVIINAFFEVDPRKPFPGEISVFFDRRSPVQERIDGINIIRSALVNLAGVVFNRAPEALAENSPGFRIEVPIIKGLALPGKCAALFNKTIGHRLGVSIGEESTRFSNSMYYNVTWGPKSEKTLRNLLDVPRLPNPEDPRDFMHLLNAQRRQGEGTDVSFKVENKLFHAHKAIVGKNQTLKLLIERAFCKTSDRDMRRAGEGEKGSKDSPILLQNISPTSFEAVLEYLYTERVFFGRLEIQEIMELATLADAFSITSLKKLCCLRLLLSLTQKNTKEIEAFAKRIGDKKLLRACQPFQIPNPEINIRILLRTYFGKMPLEFQQESQFQDFLVSFTKVILYNVQHALASHQSGVFVNFLGLTNNPNHGAGKISSLLSTLTSSVFEEIFGLKISQEFYQTPSKPSCFFVTWDAQHDKDLRCLLGVPYEDKGINGEHRLNEQRKTKQNTDIFFLVGGKLFPAHRIILSQYRYFLKIFALNIVKDGCIIIKEAQEETFETLLEYLYTGEVYLSGRSTKYLIDLAKLAAEVGIPMLKKLCLFHLVNMLSRNTLPEITAYAKEIEDFSLLRSCELFSQLSEPQAVSQPAAPHYPLGMNKDEWEWDFAAPGYI